MARGVLAATFVVGLLLAQTPAKSSKLPSDFKRCAKTDPDVDKCLKEAVQTALRLMQNGIPSLKVLPIDPLIISKIEIQESPDRPVSLNLLMKDAKMDGLSAVKITKVKSNLDERHVLVEALVPTLNLTGDYEMDGKFLVLPLKGRGKLFSQTDNAIVNLELKAEPKIKHGDIYWDITDFKVKLGDVTNFKNQYDNLFNGDETLAKPTIAALNSNWKEYWESLRPTLEETFGAVFRNIAKTVVAEVPEKSLFL